MRSRCLRAPLVCALLFAAVQLLTAATASADTLVYVKSGYVYVANADGSGARPVSPQSDWWKWPSESDGGTIAVAGGAAGVNSGGSTETSGSSEIYAFDQHAHSLLSTPVHTPGSVSSPGFPTYVNHFRLSPDGGTVAYNVLGCCGASGESTFMSPLRSGASWSDFFDDYVNPDWVDAGGDPYVNAHSAVGLTHNGATFGSQPQYGIFDASNSSNNGGWAGDAAIPDGWGYYAAFTHDAKTMALLLDNGADAGGTATQAKIQLESLSYASGGTNTDDCTIALDPSKYSGAQTSVSFTRDGSTLAWSAADGIYEANVSNPTDCGAVNGSVHLVVPGGGWPSFGAAALSPPSPPTLKPVAAFNFAPGHPHAKHSVRFDAHTSHETGGRIVSYRWSFGDGSRAVSGPTVKHSFKRHGRYVVTLTITDAARHTATTKRRVVVK